MAGTFAPQYKLKIVQDLAALPLKAALVGSGYAFTPATDQFMSAVPSGSIIGAVALSAVSASLAGGIASLNAGQLTFTGIPAGTQSGTAIVVYDATTSTPATQRIISVHVGGTNMPVAPNGLDFKIGFAGGIVLNEG